MVSVPVGELHPFYRGNVGLKPVDIEFPNQLFRGSVKEDCTTLGIFDSGLSVGSVNMDRFRFRPCHHVCLSLQS